MELRTTNYELADNAGGGPPFRELEGSWANGE